MDFPQVKAIVIILEDETFVTTDKTACMTVSACFSLPEKIWKRIAGQRPWKTLDQILDRKKNGQCVE